MQVIASDESQGRAQQGNDGRGEPAHGGVAQIYPLGVKNQVCMEGIMALTYALGKPPGIPDEDCTIFPVRSVPTWDFTIRKSW